MRLKFLSITILLISLNSFAQQFKVTWKDPVLSNTSKHFLPCSDGGFLCLIEENTDKRGKINPVLYKYDKDLQLVNHRSFEADNDGYKFYGIKKMKNNVLMFISNYDKETKNTSYFVIVIDENTLQMQGSPVEITEIAKKSDMNLAISPSLETDKDILSQGIVLSKDSTKFLFFGEIEPTLFGGNIEKYLLVAFDYTGKKLYEKEISTNYKLSTSQLIDYYINNDGKSSIIFRYYKGGISEDKDNKSQLKMITVDASSPTTITTDEDIFNNGKRVYDMKYAYEDNNEILLFARVRTVGAGMVGRWHYSHFILYSVNKMTNKVAVKKEYEYPQELLDQLDIDDKGKKSGESKGIGAFELQKVLTRENGSIDFLLWIQFVYYGQNGGQKYFIGGALDINYSKNGKVVVTRIPFEKNNFDGFYSETNCFVKNNQLYIFYNDLKENIEQDLKKKPSLLKGSYKKSYLSVSIVDSNGELTRKVIYANEGLPGNLITDGLLLRLNENKLLLKADGVLESKFKYMLGTLEF